MLGHSCNAGYLHDTSLLHNEGRPSADLAFIVDELRVLLSFRALILVQVAHMRVMRGAPNPHCIVHRRLRLLPLYGTAGR